MDRATLTDPTLCEFCDAPWTEEYPDAELNGTPIVLRLCPGCDKLDEEALFFAVSRADARLYEEIRADPAAIALLRERQVAGQMSAMKALHLYGDPRTWPDYLGGAA